MEVLAPVLCHVAGMHGRTSCTHLSWRPHPSHRLLQAPEMSPYKSRNADTRNIYAKRLARMTGGVFPFRG